MSSSKALVSVILPNYNGAEFIEASIQSVLNQTYNNIELHIIDDCSKDNSVAIIEKTISHHNNCFLHKLKRNHGGPAEPRNTGLKHAKGEYLAFIDSDDIWHPEKINFQLKLMSQHNSKFCSSHKRNFKTPVPQNMIANLSNMNVEKKNYSDLIKKNTINTSAAVVHKDCIASLKFDNHKNLIAVEDYDLWLNILKHNYPHVLILKQETVYYRLQDNSISRSKLKMVKKVIRVLNKHEKSFIKKSYYFILYAIKSIKAIVSN